MKVLVVGASGFLGANVALAARDVHVVVAHSSSTADLGAPGSGIELVRMHRPDVVVNCAALADVDACERRPDDAHRLNAELPGELAEACAGVGTRLVHISTDAVFGAEAGPYTVASEPEPTNEYGRTKLDGERAALAADPTALVVRTNIVGWSPSGRRSLLEFFVNHLDAGEPVNGFTDTWFRPVAASDVWSIVDHLGSASGIVHATGADLVSKYDFGVAVARTFGYDESLVRPGTLADAGLTAARGTRMDVVPSIDTPPTVAETLERLRSLADAGHRKELAAWTS